MSAPALPPKPIHLTSAFTGTLDSEALRSYIRQQSIHNLKARSRLDVRIASDNDDAVSYMTDQKDETHTISELKIRIDDDDDEEDLKWGTARQSPSIHTPIKAAYIKLETLFHPEEDSTTSSAMTVRRQYAHRSQSSQAEERYESAALHPFASLKLPRRKKKGHVSSPVTPTDDHHHHSSPFASESETQRSREPSVVSRISDYPYGEEGTFDASTRAWLVVKDGSSFEHANPESIIVAAPKTKNVKQEQERFLVTGPPPLRPSSRLVDTLPSLDVQTIDSELLLLPQEVEVIAKTASVSSYTSSDSNIKRQARALYPFSGQASFNELTLSAGQLFDIVTEDVGGGWSLAEADSIKGLVPHGWYTYVQEFSSSPVMLAEAGAKSPTKPDITTNGSQSAAMTTTQSLLLSPPLQSASKMARSKSNGSHILSPSEALEQQMRWDRTRPASASGQVYSGIPSSGSAIQALTHMQRTGSASSNTLSRNAGQQIPMASSLGEVSTEEINNSVSASGSEGLAISTAFTTPGVDESAEQKSTAFFLPTWKPAALLGGRTLNRFAPFVTSGAEDFLLRSSTRSASDQAEDYKIEIGSGHYGGACWKHPGMNISIRIECPEVHIGESGQDYVAYKVFSSYVLVNEGDTTQFDPHALVLGASMTSSVYRRFKQFRWLYSYANKMYPALMMSMPSFPNASYTAGKKARLDLNAAEQRRRHLQTWLIQMVRHPVLCNDAAVRFFLDCEEIEDDWSLAAQVVFEEQQRKREALPSLFHHISHPHFNVDTADAAIEGTQVQLFNHTFNEGLSTAETGVIPSLQAIRETSLASSTSYRQMSYALLRLITGSHNSKANATGPLTMLDDQMSLPPMGKIGCRDSSGATNEERAWCWREGCKECKSLTRSIQCTAEGLQMIANSYEKHTNNALYDLQDRLANKARAISHQTGLMETHKATIAMSQQATEESHEVKSVDESIASRCETVLNVTMSEMDRIHTERVQDWSSMNKELINSQIDFYENILTSLKQVRDDNALREQGPDEIVASNGALLPSPYEVHLNAPLRAQPLLQPQDPTSSSSYFGIW